MCVFKHDDLVYINNDRQKSEKLKELSVKFNHHANFFVA